MRWALVLPLMGLVLGGCGSHPPARVESREGPRAAPVHTGWYRVKPGDTLYSIAMGYGLNYHRLAAWNGIRAPYVIRPGQRLRLFPPAGSGPPGWHTPARARKGRATPPPPRTRDETVKRPPRQHPARGPAKAHKGWIWPARGRVVGLFRKNDKTRQGIRIDLPVGTLVRAAAEGEVVYSGAALRNYGKLVILRHGADYLSAYGFNRRLRVREGQRVRPGAILAESGRAPGGRPLLYFEIWHNGEPTDPLRYLPRR